MRYLRHVSLLLALLLLPWAAVAQSLHPDGQVGTTAQVTCTSTATLLLAANPKRRSFTISIPSSVPLANTFIGFTSGVTAASGEFVTRGGSYSDATYLGDVWCIVTGPESNTATVGEVSR